jgi:UDP-N-acetylmuramate: L-alanyl-gamma-D-glutamyl-meso-diaminopimelate ligase
MSLEGASPSLRRIHLIGICGTGMGALAGLLCEAGHQVTGSDRAVYPPMSDQLRDRGIAVMEGFDAAHLDPAPDLVIVGNIATRDNPEAQVAAERGIPFLSMPQAIARLFLSGRHPMVVGGTHGKTSTSALLAWILSAAGRDPSFLVGGVLCNFGRSYTLGRGDEFVIEGDEYETAFFDKGSKFFHYQPRTAIVTSVEFDHAEMFADLGAIEQTFRRFVGLLPSDGLLVLCADDANARRLSEAVRCPVETYGVSPDPTWRAEVRSTDEEGTIFDVFLRNEPLGPFSSPMCGLQNVRNALAVIAAAASRGLEVPAIREGLRSFEGIKRRQEVRGVADGVIVIDDFAHHPTAVRLTLAGIRERYAGRPLWAVFEPRTNTSRRNVFQQEYAASFDAADHVIIAAVDHAERVPLEHRFSGERLVADLQTRGRSARHVPGVPAIVELLRREAIDDAVVVVMSNGAFGGIHDLLLEALRKRRSGRPAPGGRVATT